MQSFHRGLRLILNYGGYHRDRSDHNSGYRQVGTSVGTTVDTSASRYWSVGTSRYWTVGTIGYWSVNRQQTCAKFPATGVALG